MSGLSVTQLGLGLAALGRPGYINLGHGDDLDHDYSVAAMEAQTHDVLDAAWAAGIRYFDAARSYGKAEEFLSTWLEKRDIGAGEVTIGSKWGYTYTADWEVHLPEGEKHEVKDHSLPVLQRQIRESRELLGEHLDLYQVHSATLESGILSSMPVLEELARLRNTGLAIGFSVSGPQQAETIRRALEIEFDGERLFSAVQATWNLMEQAAGPALQAASDAGLGVIIKEALANGRLTPRNDSPDFQASLAAVPAGEYSVDALALAAVIHQPFVDVALSGAARVDHLRSNLQALEIPWDEHLAEALGELEEPSAVYWETRSRLEWN